MKFVHDIGGIVEVGYAEAEDAVFNKSVDDEDSVGDDCFFPLPTTISSDAMSGEVRWGLILLPVDRSRAH